MVGLLHTLLGKNADIGNGVLHAPADDTLAMTELTVMQIHAAAAILAAQDGFAPSQIVPDSIATALTTVCATAE